MLIFLSCTNFARQKKLWKAHLYQQTSNVLKNPLTHRTLLTHLKSTFITKGRSIVPHTRQVQLSLNSLDYARDCKFPVLHHNCGLDIKCATHGSSH